MDFCAGVSIPMDVIMLNRTQKSYERREPLVTRGLEKFDSSVKPEHVDKPHETVARQQGIPAGWHGNLASLHDMSWRRRDRKHPIELVHCCPAGLDRRPNSRSCGLSVETAM